MAKQHSMIFMMERTRNNVVFRGKRCILSDIRTEEMMEVSFARKQPVRQLACIHISCEKCVYAPFAHYVGRTFGLRGKMQF